MRLTMHFRYSKRGTCKAARVTYTTEAKTEEAVLAFRAYLEPVLPLLLAAEMAEDADDEDPIPYAIGPDDLDG